MATVGESFHEFIETEIYASKLQLTYSNISFCKKKRKKNRVKEEEENGKNEGDRITDY